MKLFRIRFFNSDRQVGSKLIDTYVLAKDLRTGALEVCKQFEITADDACVCLLMATKDNILVPQKRKGEFELFKAMQTDTNGLYIVDKDINRAKARLGRKGYDISKFDISPVRKPFFVVSYKRNKEDVIYEPEIVGEGC